MPLLMTPKATSMAQLDLFAAAEPVSAADLREQERFGRADALSWWSLPNRHSSQLTGERLEAYVRSFREARRAMLEPT